MSNDRSARVLGHCHTLTVLLVLMLVAAPLATRFGLIHFKIGLLLTALAVLLSAVMLAAALLMLCWPKLRANRSRLLRIAAIALLPVAIGARVIVPNLDRPAIHDIATDIADPPQFIAAPMLRSSASNPLQRDATLDAAQSAGYPQLQGISSELTPEQAYERVLATAESLHWNVHFTAPERGLIEASETTFWFGFIDDVVIRVRPAGSGSRIDLRSVSRVGQGDLGANADRIERFLRSFQESS